MVGVGGGVFVGEAGVLKRGKVQPVTRVITEIPSRRTFNKDFMGYLDSIYLLYIPINVALARTWFCTLF
jgi:hypothetical protein